MKQLTILVILCIMCGCDPGTILAQIPAKSSYPATDNITSLSSVNLRPAYDLLNFPLLNNSVNWERTLTDLAKNSDINLYITNRNHYDLINTPPLFLYGASNVFPKQLVKMNAFGNICSFSSKRVSLTSKPVIDTTYFYFYPLKRTNEPTLSDRWLYRTAAFIIIRTMSYTYPNTDLPPKYPFRDISKK
jgi:hypothetical protein